jgi:hypothetical protein
MPPMSAIPSSSNENATHWASVNDWNIENV